MAKFFLVSKFLGPLVGIFICGVFLAACDDPSVDRRAEIEKAIAFSGAPVVPTLNPTQIAIRDREALGFSIVILGTRDFYPDRKNETIPVVVINERETSIFLSQLCNSMLQRQIGEKRWDDIAFGRPCPPSDTQAYQVFPHTQVRVPFEFGKTRPLKDKSWQIPGTYRILLTYFLRCPDAFSGISFCENQSLAQTDPFQIKFDAEGSPTP